MSTPVYFCKYTDTLPSGEEFTEITAILPSLPATPGNYVCYAHIGQHGECSRTWVRRHAEPAWQGEYQPLLDELEQIGYDDLVVCDLLDKVNLYDTTNPMWD